jgi:2-keto-4-pentenoate hydratase/2-oxohepta-3-ene-1,7-dioic acid hydratase in catechol pathway
MTMKLVRYGLVDQKRPGVLDGQGRIGDLSGYVPDIAGATLLPETIASWRSVESSRLSEVPGTPRLGACVGSMGKIIGVGLNCKEHAAESGMSIPSEPPLFIKPPSAIVGPNDDVQIPLGSEKTDWEVELGVVIGKPGKYLGLEQAMEHVAGYCVVNDISERAYQLERGGQWDKGKSCDTFAPLGPWLVTADEIPDPQNLDVWLEVDGRTFQKGNTRLMIFGIAQLVAYISQFMSLRSGGIISTGTPPGVGLGQKPPLYLEVRQTMRLGISGLGIQDQRTVSATIG